MNAVRWASLILFCAIMAAFAQDVRSWELLIAALALMLVLFWSCGAFKPEVWFGTPEQDAECARIDQELDEINRAPRRL